MESITFSQILYCILIMLSWIFIELLLTILDIHFYMKRGYRSWHDQDEEYFKTPYNVRIKKAWYELYKLVQNILKNV